MTDEEYAPTEDEMAAHEASKVEVLRVRYKGTSDQRIITRRDLARHAAGDSARALLFHPGDEVPLLFHPGDEVPWTELVDLAGEEELARQMVLAHLHEFELVGPGAAEALDVPGAEEFEIGGVEK